MALKLKDNLSSDYFKAAQKLYSKKTKKRVVAYVESYDDIAFWRDILGEFENETRYFQVMLPSSTSLTKGKKMVLINTLRPESLGENLIACVDSDYDYLFQQATHTSRVINNNNYILQTYVYAIENFQCLAETLHEVCVKATLNDKSIFDFEAYLIAYSEIIYPLFLWTLWFYKERDTNTFPMGEFNSYTRVYKFSIRNPEASLDIIAHKVGVKLRALEREYPEKVAQVEAFGKELVELGVQSYNTYLFIQGHHLKDQVIMKMLVPICSELRKLRERYIRRLAKHEEQYKNELTAYQNSQLKIDIALKQNRGFNHHPFYFKIKKDIQKLLKEGKRVAGK